MPSAYFNVWPDQWYHTSGDTADKSDSTQFKRVVVISTATAVFLANAGPGEGERMMAEVGSKLRGRLGLEKGKAEKFLQDADGKSVHTAFRESLNIVNQSFAREKEALSSVRFFFKGDKELEDALASRLRTLDEAAGLELREIESLYAARCRGLKVAPGKPAPDKDEVRLAGFVPVRTAKMGGMLEFWKLRDKIRELKYSPPPAIAAAQFELRNFIDGKRSILDIRNAASAEYGPLRLVDVEAYMKFLERLGMVEIRTSRTVFPVR